MKINRNNYESFFLDFHEGILDKNSVNELMDFLASNPDLRAEFEGFQNISLNIDEDVRFGDKESLKKNTISADNYKTWLIAFVENDLDTPQRIEVEEFLERNPAYKAELKLLHQTKLLPDTGIRFKNKSSLKKKGGVVIPMWIRTAAAAAVVMGIMAYWFTGNENVKQVADTTVPKANTQEIKTADSQVKANPVAPEQKSSDKVMASTPVKKINNKNYSNTSHTADPAMNQTAVQTTKVDEEKKSDIIPVASLRQSIAEDEPRIVINATGKNTGENKNAGNNSFVALDDSDLAELGLKSKDSISNDGVLRTALQGAGNLLGIHVKHTSEDNLASSTTKQTFALGKIEFSRTVSR